MLAALLLSSRIVLSGTRFDRQDGDTTHARENHHVAFPLPGFDAELAMIGRPSPNPVAHLLRRPDITARKCKYPRPNRKMPSSLMQDVDQP